MKKEQNSFWNTIKPYFDKVYYSSKSVDDILDIVEENTSERQLFSYSSSFFTGDIYDDGFEISQVPYGRDSFTYKIEAYVKDVYDGFDENKRTEIKIHARINTFTAIVSVFMLVILLIVLFSSISSFILDLFSENKSEDSLISFCFTSFAMLVFFIGLFLFSSCYNKKKVIKKLNEMFD